MSKIILTGIKPTGMPHLGNYIGAIRPALQLAQNPGVQSYLFIADYHSLTTIKCAKTLNKMVYEVASAWLASGLNPEKTVFYRQSDVPELFELNWILSCIAPKGLMNRGHSYKAITQANRQVGQKEEDKGVNMGLYNYPLLMSADILLFSAEEVPVSEDQKQHLEVTRDLALKFNHIFKTNLLVPPRPLIKSRLIPGVDGEKMSKSKGNHIPLFDSAKDLRKKIMRIKTDSSSPEEPKDPEKSLLFSLYKAFGSEEKTQNLQQKYHQGIGWGKVKELLYILLEEYLSEKRKQYHALMADSGQVDQLLKEGAGRARERAKPFLHKIRRTIGMDRQ